MSNTLQGSTPLWARLIAFMCVLTVICAACGGEGAPAGPEESDTSAGMSDEMVNDGVLRIGGGTTGGTAERAAGVMARIIEQNLDGYTGAVLPGSGRSNLVNIKEGAAELAMGVPSGLESAYTGTGDFEGEPVEDIRYGGEMFPDTLVFTLIARPDAGITSVSDLVGKRLAPGEQASLSAQQFTPTVLESAGITYEDITDGGGEIIYTPFGDAIQHLRDGQVDAVVHQIAHPNAELTTIDATQGLTFVSLSDEELAFAAERLAGWAPTTIPADTYESLEADWQTLSTSLVWGVAASVPDDLVYEMTKAFYSNPELWSEAGEGWDEQVSVEEAFVRHPTSGMSVPVHPGALRFYQEQGLTD